MSWIRTTGRAFFTTIGLRYCDQRQFDIPWLTNFKLSGAYPLPYRLRVSAVFQSTAGEPLVYTYLLVEGDLEGPDGRDFRVPSVSRGTDSNVANSRWPSLPLEQFAKLVHRWAHHAIHWGWA